MYSSLVNSSFILPFQLNNYNEFKPIHFVLVFLLVLIKGVLKKPGYTMRRFPCRVCTDANSIRKIKTPAQMMGRRFDLSAI